MTDLDAILRAVLADPHDDTPRLVYADELNDLAGVVACPRCSGKGWTRATYRVAEMDRDDPPCVSEGRCAVCAGSGSVSNGMAERAEFIRVQCELARADATQCSHPPTCDPKLFGPHNHAASCRVGRQYRRQVELFTTHGAAWFGPRATLTPPNEREQRAGGEWLIVRRGFVDEIRTGLSQFVGGGCGQCGHQGRYSRSERRADGLWHQVPVDPCPACSGTGRVGLDLAAVFAAHPIARVVLADREPTAASHPSGAWHWTWVGNDADSRVGLPRKLMAALSASGIARVFDSRDAAMDALSLACVNLGRAAAGLDPLT